MDIIRVGVVGVGRGKCFMDPLLQGIGYRLTAVCDIWEAGLEEVKKSNPDIKTFTNYHEFLTEDFEVVVLANYFHEHALFAIEAIRAGKHVISETLPAGTMAELCALVKTVRASQKLYMLAENYPFIACNQEMRRLYENGEIGEVMYAEGEYNHPFTAPAQNKLAPEETHWRNLLPSTYYSTHALAPLMTTTATLPVSVTGFSISAGRDKVHYNTLRQQDPGSVMLCTMNNGAVFRIFGMGVPGHSIWYRFHGSDGAMECERGTGYAFPQSYWGSGKVRVWHEPESLLPQQKREILYFPEWPDHAKEAQQSGHSGADYFVMLHFAQALRGEKKLDLGIIPAASMTAVAILGWRSCLENGKPYDIPDFTKEESYRQYENDWKSPFADGDNRIPCTILSPRTISPEEKAYAKTFWDRM